MSDARASAPWETIRTGLQLLATVWGVQIGFSVASRLLWTLIFSSLKSSSSGFDVTLELIDVLSLFLEVVFTAIAVALAVAASKLRRFPLVQREAPPGDPYRGARDAGPARDPGLDGLATGVMVAFGATAGLGVVSYAYNTLFAHHSVADPSLGFRAALWGLSFASALVAGALFTVWAWRAAREVARPLSPVLVIASSLGLAVCAAFQGWEVFSRVTGGQPPWAHWVGLVLDGLSTGALILVALGTAEALRDPGTRNQQA